MKWVKAPICTSYPSDTIGSHSSRTKRDKDPFATVNSPKALVEETYLITTISC